MISGDKSSFEFQIRNDRVHNWYYLDIICSTPVPNVSVAKISDKDKVSTRNNIQLSFNYDTKSYQGKGRLKTWLAVLGIPLRVIRNEDKNDFNIYVNESDTTRGRKRNRTPFLKFIPKNGTSKIFDISNSNFRSSKIQISRNIFAEGKEGWNKRLETNFQGNCRYYLSLRGFLLYLLGIESIFNKDKPPGQKIYKNKYTKQDRRYQTNTKINRLIKALMLNRYTKSDFPFLVNYHIFDAVFGKNYKVSVLKEIAFELQHQLNTLDNDFLIYWITRRFHDEMIYSYAKPSFPYPIYHPIQISLWKNNVKNKYEKDISLKEIICGLKKYDKKMLEYLAHYHEKCLKNTRNLTRKI